MLLEEILQKDRRLRVLHLELKKESYYRSEITRHFSDYLDAYCVYNHLTAEEVLQSYHNFVAEYLGDLKAFQATGLYPFQRGENRSKTRQDYDLALILSAFFEKVRHAVFAAIADSYQTLTPNEQLLFIGLGPGLELELLEKPARVDAYDTSLAPFVKNRFSQHHLVEELFIEKPGGYNRIYCVELLEHIPDPEGLIKHMAVSLKPGGLLYFTTASDMPQFDHLVNFTGRNLTSCFTEANLVVLEEKELLHSYATGGLKSGNTWYICRKT